VVGEATPSKALMPSPVSAALADFRLLASAPRLLPPDACLLTMDARLLTMDARAPVEPDARVLLPPEPSATVAAAQPGAATEEEEEELLGGTVPTGCAPCRTAALPPCDLTMPAPARMHACGLAAHCPMPSSGKRPARTHRRRRPSRLLLGYRRLPLAQGGVEGCQE